MKPYLSVVIPSYNEEENIKSGVLEEIYKYLSKQKYTWEVLVSDDGSTDNSRSVAKDRVVKLKGFRVLENPHGGKPSTLRYGVAASGGKYILFTDMDQSTPINQLAKLMPFTKKGYSAIIGSRGLDRKSFPWYRRLGAVVFMSFRKSLLLSELNDTQCGFKLFEAKMLKTAFPRLEFFKNKIDVKGWRVTSYDVELLHIIKRLGGKIKEVRVLWNDEDLSTAKGGAINKYIKESKSMLVQIIKVKINDLKGEYTK